MYLSRMITGKNWPMAAAGVLLGFLLLLRGGWDFHGLYGQDAHEYHRYARALMDRLAGGPPPGDYFWSPNYPLLGGLLGFCCGGDAAWGLQLCSLLAALGTAWFGRKILLLWWPESAEEVDRWAFLALVCGPAMLKFGLLGMSDMVAALGVMGAWHGAVRFAQSAGASRSALLGAAFWAAWAVGARYAVAPLLLPAGVWVLWTLRARHGVPLLAALAVAAVPLLPYIVWKGDTPAAFVQHEWLARWSPVHFFRSAFPHPDGDLQYPLPNLVYAAYAFVHPAIFPAALLLVPFWRPGDGRTGGKWALLAAVAVYGLFLAGIPFQNLRFHLPAYPLVAILAFPAWRRLVGKVEEKGGKTASRWLFAGLLAVQVLVLARSLWPVVQLARTEQRLARALMDTGAPVAYVFYVDGAVRTHGYAGELKNLWFPQDTPFVPGAAVLFNERQFAPLFPGRAIGRNFAALHAQRTDTLAAWPDGWVLLRIAAQRGEGR